jgi:hypothetical protein
MKKTLLSLGLLLAVVIGISGVAVRVDASHSWGSYHWARTSNPFTLKVGDNVSSAWDAYLDEAISDWSVSSVLDLTEVLGSTKPHTCKPKTGQIEVCSERYGNTGWLGLAQIWVSGSHITKAISKVNDTYFNTSAYNKPEWRRLVMCQEIAHDFGLDHQDEKFNNANLGSCMDYTNNPSGPPSNEHPNQHDYDILETIYAHLDSTNTILASAPSKNRNVLLENQSEWGKATKKDGQGRDNVFVRDLGRGEKILTHVFWVE